MTVNPHAGAVAIYGRAKVSDGQAYLIYYINHDCVFDEATKRVVKYVDTTSHSGKIVLSVHSLTNTNDNKGTSRRMDAISTGN